MEANDERNRNARPDGLNDAGNRQDAQKGNSADHIASTPGKEWTQHDTEPYTSRAVDGEEDLQGESVSSDYVDADDRKELDMQDGTFYTDEGTERQRDQNRDGGRL